MRMILKLSMRMTLKSSMIFFPFFDNRFGAIVVPTMVELWTGILQYILIDWDFIIVRIIYVPLTLKSSTQMTLKSTMWKKCKST